MAVSIIIVNYNVSDEVKRCIESILKNCVKLSVEIIVIDNNSPERNIEFLKELYPEVRFEFLKENLGYSKANNLAVKFSKYENILFLNPDTLLIEDFITPIVYFAKSDKSAGACGPMLLYEDLSYQNSYGTRMGFIYETAEAFMFINIYRKFKKFLNSKKFKLNKPFHVDWMSGACLYMKKNIFEEVGGFDNDFFLNYEDIDLCKRIENKGYKNYYFPYLKCIHLDQTSQKRDYSSFVYNRYLSRITYGNKNYNFMLRCIINLVHITGLFLRLLFVFFNYSGTERIQRKKGYIKSLKLYF